MSLMSDAFLPALPVSNVSFHSSHLPGDWFSMKLLLLLVPVLRLQTPMCLLGLRSYFFPFLSSSSSLSLIFVPLLKISQASMGFCLFPLSSFKSRQVGANSLAVFLSFFPLSYFLSQAALSLYLSGSANWAEISPWSAALLYVHTVPADILVHKDITWLKYTCNH